MTDEVQCRKCGRVHGGELHDRCSFKPTPAPIYARCPVCGRIYDVIVFPQCPNQHVAPGVPPAAPVVVAAETTGPRRSPRLLIAVGLVLLPVVLVGIGLTQYALLNPASTEAAKRRDPPRAHTEEPRQAPADHLSLKTGDSFKECDLCPVMVAVQTGSFVMGSPEAEYGHDRTETPQHVVTITRDFAVGKYEVTVREYVAFLNASAQERRFQVVWVLTAPGEQTASILRIDKDEGLQFFARPDREEHPVTFVSWFGAIEYTNWLSRKTGATYRLLSEAEWEYVARAGATTAYHFGDDALQLCDYGNIADLSGMKKNKLSPVAKCDDGFSDLAPVGRLRPNALGLFDLIGNAAEWVEDCSHTTYDRAPTDGSPWIVGGNCNSRMVRGGNFQSLPAGVRSAQRYANSADARSGTLGLRVARSRRSQPRQPKGPEERAGRDTVPAPIEKRGKDA